MSCAAQVPFNQQVRSISVWLITTLFRQTAFFGCSIVATFSICDDLLPRKRCA